MTNPAPDPFALLRGLDPAASIVGELGPDEIRDARARALRLAAERDSLDGDRSAGRRRSVTRLAIGLAAAALLVALSLTPPGRAVAERLGELVGIGDAPSREAASGIDEPAVVIGAGESPNGTRYEVVASADTNIYRDEHPTTCIGLDMPNADGPSNEGCLTDAVLGSLDRTIVSPIAFLGSRDLGADRLIVDGLASSRVRSAEIERIADDGSIERYPVEVSHLEGELAAEIGATGEAAFLLAFLPETLVPPPPQPFPPEQSGVAEASPPKQALARLSLVAFGADGTEIARESLGSAPNSDLSLYMAESMPGNDAADQILEDCFRELLPRYGTPGEIKPQLPTGFGEELNSCAQARRQDEPGR